MKKGLREKIQLGFLTTLSTTRDLQSPTHPIIAEKH